MCVVLMGCQPSSSTDEVQTEEGQQTQLPLNRDSITAGVSSRGVEPAPTVDQIAGRVLKALKDKNWKEVARYVHSEQGVCFTPEVYVSKSDQVFMADQLTSENLRQQKRNWGDKYGPEGQGDMSLESYYDRYIMDVDFTQADSVFYDKDKQWGNSINNARKAFESPYIVEYYINGVNPDFGGMDWRALRLVFSPDEEGWGLVGVVHAAWSP